jgi:predicted nucleotidyltransferase
MAAGEKTNIPQTSQTKSRFDGKIPFITSLITSSIDKKYLKKVYLFGSYAYGKPNEDSDIDIFVIIDDIYDNRKAYLDIKDKLIDNKIYPCDLIVRKEIEFKEGMEENAYNFEKIIYNHGVVLYG